MNKLVFCRAKGYIIRLQTVIFSPFLFFLGVKESNNTL